MKFLYVPDAHFSHESPFFVLPKSHTHDVRMISPMIETLYRGHPIHTSLVSAAITLEYVSIGHNVQLSFDNVSLYVPAGHG